MGGAVLFTDLPEKSQHHSLLSALQSQPSYLPPPQNLAPPVKVVQLCPNLCNPMDCSPPDSSVHGILQVRILKWVAVPSQGDLPIPGIKPRSPTLQADFLLSKPPGKPRNTGVGSLSLLQGIFLTQGLKQGLQHCRQTLYQLSYLTSAHTEQVLS